MHFNAQIPAKLNNDAGIMKDYSPYVAKHSGFIACFYVFLTKL